jgi:peptidoglycan/LPS O-acetylase OafA/YrhL
VLLVVLAHAGVGFLKGGYVGVDVFFVLSGFLITGILLSGVSKHGYLSLSNFYARRARRILPAAALTLVTTDIVAYYLLNFVRARQAVTDSIWASFLVSNVRFAREGTDYFAQGQPPSPIQHFWSLSVEEQFYLVWPGLLSVVLFGFVLRRYRASPDRADALNFARRRRLLAVIIAVSAASLAWSIHYTSVKPAAAYFSTAARVWELGLGAALAIAAGGFARAPALLRAAIGWIGLVCIGCAAVAFSESTPFPGYSALLPTLGAALVIAAGIGEQQVKLGVGRLLSLAPFRYVGDRSYAYYLWHWPALIIAVQYAGHDLSVGTKLLLVSGAFAVSIVSYGLFENPIRQMRWRSPAGVVLWPVSAATVSVIAVIALSAIDDKAAHFDAAAARVSPAALADPYLATTARADSKPLPAVIAAVNAARRGAPLPTPLSPPVDKLLKDNYSFPSGCVPSEGETSSSKICRLGDASSAKTIVVMGDSHLQHWMPAILALADTDGWVVVPLVKSACAPGSWLRYPSKPECPAWYKWAVGQAKSMHPQVTLVGGAWDFNHLPVQAAASVSALTTTMKRFSSSVVIIGDPPPQKRQPLDCVLAPHATMRTCSTTATKKQLSGDLKVAANARKQHIGFIDTRGWFCARTSRTKLVYLCPLVINKTITRLDLSSHITVTYSQELAAPFRAAFRRALFGG